MDTLQKRGPMFSNRTLVTMTIPIILDALLAIAAGVVDSAMVSSAGEAAVSAVSLVDSINVMFITFFNAIGIGGSVVTAQYVGKGDREKASTSANQILYAAIAFATAVSLVMVPCRNLVLRLVYGSVEEAVFANAGIYAFYTMLGFPFYAVGAASAAVLRSMGKNRQSVTITMVSNLFNVAGNAILIYGFRMGVEGAAIATALSRVVYAVLGLVLAHKKNLPARFHKVLQFRLNFDIMRRVLKVGLTQGLENFSFQLGKLLIASLVSTFGTIAIAANSVSFTINDISWTVMNAYSTVILTVVGQCMGAGEKEQAKGYVVKLVKAGLVTMLILSSTIFALRHQLVRIFDFAPETLEVCAYHTAVRAIVTVCALYPCAFGPMAAFRAAGDIKYAVNVSMIAMFVCRVALCFALNAIFPNLGLMCIHIGMWADWGFRSVMNAIRFRSGKWLQKKLI